MKLIITISEKEAHLVTFKTTDSQVFDEMYLFISTYCNRYRVLFSFNFEVAVKSIEVDLQNVLFIENYEISAGHFLAICLKASLLSSQNLLIISSDIPNFRRW